MLADPIAHNLDIVHRHIRDEARDPAGVMALYSDDIVLEMPTRGLRLEGKPAIEANYRAMFGAMEEVEIQPGDRFATPPAWSTIASCASVWCARALTMRRCRSAAASSCG